MADDRIAVLFDIDGTLITTSGAGAASWRLAFDELYGIPADIGEFTDAGMTDPAVGRKTFEAVPAGALALGAPAFRARSDAHDLIGRVA